MQGPTLLRTLALIAFVPSVLQGCSEDPPPQLIPLLQPDISKLEEHARRQIALAQDKTNACFRDLSRADRALCGEAFLELGRRYHASELRDAAETAYRNAQALMPDDYRCAYLLGHIYKETGQSDKSIEQFISSIKSLPGRTNKYKAEWLAAQYWLGEAYLEDNRPDLAQQAFQQILEHAADMPAALAGLGRVAALAGSSGEAVQYFEAALARAPQASDIKYRLGVEYRKLGDLEKAKALLRGVEQNKVNIKLTPPDPLLAALRALRDSSQSYSSRAHRAFLAGNLEAAVAGYTKAVEAAPNNASLRVRLAGALGQSGDLAAAERQLLKALELNPNSIEAHFSMGVVEARRSRWDKAAENYVRVLALDPKMKRAHFNLANTLGILGRYADAMVHYNTVIALDPAHAIARTNLAIMLILQDRYRETLESLEASLAVLPEDVGLTHLLARLLATAEDDAVRDGPRSLALARQVFQADNQLKHVETLAMAHAENGDFETAVKWQEQALRVVRAAKRSELEKPLLANLQLFRRGQPSRAVLPEDNPFGLAATPGKAN